MATCKIQKQKKNEKNAIGILRQAIKKYNYQNI